jgi:uncharacterized phage protein gp47/JayE
MATFGLTDQGFIAKPIAQILSDMQAVELDGIAPNLNLQPPDPIAVLTGEVAAEVSELWQVVAAIYAGIDPDAASGDQLTGLSLLTGTTRLGPQATQVIGCIVNVEPGTYAAGTMFAHPNGNPTALFTNKADVVNSGESAANETVDFAAVDPGPTTVNAGTLNVIAQPLTGWNSITNPNAGSIGNNGEDDPGLRLRREQELQAAGASTADAIRSDVLAQLVPPKTTSETLTCTVLHNDTDVTDANGVPPHSIEVVAYQPGNTVADDIALAQLILDQKPAGIGTHGTSSATATDAEGNTETISFTRPTTTTIYVAVNVKGNVQAAAVTAALQAYTATAWQPGVSAIILALQASLFPSPIDPTIGVPGLIDVLSFKIGTTYPATGTSNITIDVRHVALLGTIDVTVTP